MLTVRRCRRRDRRGSLTVELLLVLPILLVILAGMVEFGMFLAGQQRLADAASRGARLGARGASDEAIEKHVREQVLAGSLGSEVKVQVTRTAGPPAGFAGHSSQVFVTVIVVAPARAVAPDLLSFIGVRLTDEVAAGRAVMLVE